MNGLIFTFERGLDGFVAWALDLVAMGGPLSLLPSACNLLKFNIKVAARYQLAGPLSSSQDT
jgi:hypothetical protein